MWIRASLSPATAQDRRRILSELRACSHGLAGIPQETRLVYSVLSEISGFKVGGLLNPHRDLSLSASERIPQHDSLRSGSFAAKRIYNQARLVSKLDADLNGRKPKNFTARTWRRLEKYNLLSGWLLRLRRRRPYPLIGIDKDTFADFIWLNFFQNTLQSSVRDKVLQTEFYTIKPGWAEAHSGCGRRHTAVKIDTAG